MIVKFLEPSAHFNGVGYNTDKVSQGKAELMATVNFDMLHGLTEIRPADYVNHLKAMSARNKGVREPQLHVVISTAGTSHDKMQLTNITSAWMGKMGYGKQPYLIFFHKDTDDNHVHIVSTRIDHDGRKINSGFEHIRAISALNQIMGLDEGKAAQKDLEKARSYRFSTLPQFKLILESQGYVIKDNDLIKYGKKLAVIDMAKVVFKAPDQQRANQLKAIFKKYSPQYDTSGVADFMKAKMGVELIFHAKDGKPAYGYTVIDHAQKNVYKGGEIMALKELLGDQLSKVQLPDKIQARQISQHTVAISPDIPVHINIAEDVDDEAIHGRRRKKKARANQR